MLRDKLCLNEEERLRLIQRAEIELMGQKKTDIRSTNFLELELANSIMSIRIFPSLGTFK